MNNRELARNNKMFRRLRRHNLCCSRLRFAAAFAAAAVALALGNRCAAHEHASNLIVDTDMALDDARALTMLLAAPELSIKAILTSDGSAPPLAGATNAVRILHFFGKHNVPVGAGRALGKPPPEWGERSIALGWSELPCPPDPAIHDAVAVARQALSDSSDPFIWVCLGPLSNLSDTLKVWPELTNRIRCVWYSGAPPDAPEPGWNTERDMEAARAVFSSGLRIVTIHPAADQLLRFDSDLYARLCQVDSRAAKLIARLHAHPNVQSLLTTNHFRAWDETVALALVRPSLAVLRPWQGNSNVSVLEAFDAANARAAYLEEVQPHLHADRPSHDGPVILRALPMDPEMFQPDLQPFVAEIIRRHGAEEWGLVVLTSELHRHLGVYAILGAKMGLRARELLGAARDELRVESFAGSRPPISCLNDGLQAATGATLGHGTIRIAETVKPEPAAVFYLKNRKLRMSLKEEPLRRVKDAIRAAANAYGEQTPAYFDAVRRIALEVWRDFDRTKIFDEVIEDAANAQQN